MVTPPAGHFDMLVIGTGPGGEGAAMQAVKHGKQVAVVEHCEHIGGGCTHLGTIPSKALRYAIFRLTEANHNPLLQRGRRRRCTRRSPICGAGPVASSIGRSTCGAGFTIAITCR